MNESSNQKSSIGNEIPLNTEQVSNKNNSQNYID
jgi:hypothetical protein